MTAADAERVSHTPGPWRVLQWADERKGFIAIVDGADAHIADVFPFGKRADGAPLKRHEANACLIAAAPDLLEALRDILFDMFEEINPDLAKRAKAAIAKAEGRDV